MIITGKHLSRRTILRGMGAMVALPALDAMTPALAAAAAKKADAPLRLAFAYVPNGVTMEQWTPAAEGAGFELTRILKPLAPVKDRMLVLSGLEHNNGNALGDGPGDHARAGAVFLTGVHCRKTAGADIKNGVSVDQIAARQIGSQTRLGSIELGCEDTRVVGNCDSGYSCAYTNSLSWRSESTPQPPETNPRAVFERLFGVDAGLDPATRRSACARAAASSTWSASGARRCATISAPAIAASWTSTSPRCARSRRASRRPNRTTANGCRRWRSRAASPRRSPSTSR
jgi:hypothetical protein